MAYVYSSEVLFGHPTELCLCQADTKLLEDFECSRPQYGAKKSTVAKLVRCTLSYVLTALGQILTLRNCLTNVIHLNEPGLTFCDACQYFVRRDRKQRLRFKYALY